MSKNIDITTTMTSADSSCLWESDLPEFDATIEEIDHFDARGLCRVYGRGDRFMKNRTYNMDIWLDKTGNLMMRFWTRSEYIPWRSFEIRNFDLSKIPEMKYPPAFDEHWIPKSVRESYEEWVYEEF